MKKAYRTKVAESDVENDVSDAPTEKTKGRKYFVPALGRSVEASSATEAAAIASKTLDRASDSNDDDK